MTTKSFLLFLGIFTLLGASLALRAQTATDLGDFGGGSSEANAINDQGDVVGWATESSDIGPFQEPFLYADGTLTSLGGTPEDSDSANAINDSNQVVGQTFNSNTDQYQGFVYVNGTTTDLGSLAGNSGSSDANAINSSGTVVGLSETSNYGSSSFTYSAGSMASLPLSGASGINDSGQIVGTIFNGLTSSPNAVLYSNGTLTNLGTLGGNVVAATAINNSGQIVGYSTSSGYFNPTGFLYSNGTMTSLGTLGLSSQANAINNNGEVVGTATVNYTAGLSSEDAFVFTNDSGIEDLNTLYKSLLVSGTGSQTGFISFNIANGVNDQGDIVGQGIFWNGTSDQDQAFLLEPAAVPEPSAWLLIVGGLGSLAGFMALKSSHERNRCMARAAAD